MLGLLRSARSIGGIRSDHHETGREQLADRVQRLTRILSAQRDIASADLDLESVMRLVCERASALMDAPSAGLLLLEDCGFVHRAGVGFMEKLVGREVPIEGTFTGWVYRNNRPAVCNDVRNDPRLGPLAYQRGFGSLVVVPLRHRGEERALLTLASPEAG